MMNEEFNVALKALIEAFLETGLGKAVIWAVERLSEFLNNP